jgi:hypothetical protein
VAAFPPPELIRTELKGWRRSRRHRRMRWCRPGSEPAKPWRGLLLRRQEAAGLWCAAASGKELSMFGQTGFAPCSSPSEAGDAQSVASAGCGWHPGSKILVVWPLPLWGCAMWAVAAARPAEASCLMPCGMSLPSPAGRGIVAAPRPRPVYPNGARGFFYA